MVHLRGGQAHSAVAELACLKMQLYAGEHLAKLIGVSEVGGSPIAGVLVAVVRPPHRMQAMTHSVVSYVLVHLLVRL